MDPLLEEMETPDELWYLWEYWLNMSTRRTGNGFGPNALSYSDVGWWSSLNGIRLAPFELDALNGLESLFLEHHTPKPEKAGKK